jgi:predicted phage terminase large subunit-like protein
VPPTLDELKIFGAASPAGFGWAASRGEPDPYRPALFHTMIADAVNEVTSGKLDVLMLQVPVQHGKSTTAAVLGSAQFLGTNPTKYVVAVSYSTDYAADNIGAKARGWLERHGNEYFNVTVDPRSSARHRWNVVPGGGGLSTFGIDKGVAGRRADLLIIDDPYPGIKEAMSKRFRDDAWNRYQFELGSRLAPGAGEIHIMSRWGDDDHIARLQKHVRESGARWRLIDFPALSICSECAKSDRLEYGLDGVNACGHGTRDELGRLPGEALWPEVRDREFLLGRRKAVGSRAYDALYQGRPRPDGGLMFGREWFQYAQIHEGRLILRPVMGKGMVHAVPIAACRKFQFVDPATSTEADAARFRIGTFLLTPANELIVLDMVGGTLGAPRAKALMRQQFAMHHPMAIGVEKNGLGLVFVQDLIAESMPIRPIVADKDKVSRASIATILYENGRVYHMLDAPWLREFEEELLSFPGGAFKDQVDVVSMAAIATSQAHADGPAQGVRLG